MPCENGCDSTESSLHEAEETITPSYPAATIPATSSAQSEAWRPKNTPGLDPEAAASMILCTTASLSVGSPEASSIPTNEVILPSSTSC